MACTVAAHRALGTLMFLSCLSSGKHSDRVSIRTISKPHLKITRMRSSCIRAAVNDVSDIIPTRLARPAVYLVSLNCPLCLMLYAGHDSQVKPWRHITDHHTSSSVDLNPDAP